MIQLIADERFTNIQRAQAGLTKLFQSAGKSGTFYRVLKNDQPLGVLIPNSVWEDFLEDLEASTSKKYKADIARARKEKGGKTLEQIEKELGL